MTELPPELIGGLASLPDLMIALARLKGIQRPDAERIVGLLPVDLLRAQCFLDRLTAVWRYDYGHPLVGLPGGELVFGTHMYHDVDRSFQVVSCAQQRLTPERLATYLATLRDLAKHEDALVEFTPILRLSANTPLEIEYEVAGTRDTTIDWRIRTSEGIDVLIEVKNRVKDLFEGLCKLQTGEEVDSAESSEPAHSADLLFRSVEKKFPARSATETIQAVWIRTGIKQEEGELTAAFNKLDPQRVHVAILGDWEDDVYVLANENAAKQLILRTFNICESRRFVFRKGEPIVRNSQAV